MIVRSKRPDKHFTVIQNHVIRDKRLSWRARGILIYLLSQPDDWKTSSAHLTAVGLEGRDSVRNALDELQTIGYLKRQKHQDDRGRWTTAIYVYDDPQNPQPNPQPMTGFQSSVDQASYKELHTNNSGVPISSKRKSVEPRICGQCDGAGWAIVGKGLARCSCGGGIR